MIFEPLMTIVSYVADANDKSGADLDKMWILGHRALDDLGQNFAALPKTVRLPVSGNKTVMIPADCIAWSKIGILNDKLEVSTLAINNSLTTFRDLNPSRLSTQPDIADNVPFLVNNQFFLNYYYNGIYQNLFGIGGGLIQMGSCRVDERNNVILLNTDFHYDSIILEYLSSCEKDQDYMVETRLREPIIAFIEWKLKIAPEQNYYNRAIEARRKMPNKRVTLQEVNQFIRYATGQYLKS